MNLNKQMDSLYRELSLEEIPWNLEGPPDMLVQLVDSGNILPCAAVDLGCGAGNYAAWLGTQGFEVTGVDISPRALELAQQLANKKHVSCRFLVADLLGNLTELEDSFDFAYDWEELHHVFPENRGRYVANVHRILRRGGCCLSVCFSEDDPSFGQKRKVPQDSFRHDTSISHLSGNSGIFLNPYLLLKHFAPSRSPGNTVRISPSKRYW